MNKFLTFIFITLAQFSYSQQSKQLFFNQLPDENIHFHIDEIGDLTIKNEANYTRSVKIDSNFSFVGNLKDIFSNGDIAYECNYKNNNINGEVNKYYPNGQKVYTGYYKDSKKDSIWTFFYENGLKEKTIRYRNEQPFLIDFFKRNGKCIISNGNGRLKTTITPNIGQNVKYRITGSIVNGKMDGRWGWSASRRQGAEYYENGVFINSKDDHGFVAKNQVISFIGDDLHENIVLFKFIVIPEVNNSVQGEFNIPGTPVIMRRKYVKSDIYLDNVLTYKNSADLNKTFSKDLEKVLFAKSKNLNIHQYWSFIQFSIVGESNIDDILVLSNNAQIKNITEEFLSNLTGFKSVKSDNENYKCHVYLSVFYKNSKLYIPSCNYNNMFDFN